MVEEPPDVAEKRMLDRRIARKVVLNKAFKAVLPHLQRPDVNKRLRRIATKGGVNVVIDVDWQSKSCGVW